LNNQIKMISIPFHKKKVGHSYLVWFQNSNLYLQLEEPAWFVFRKTRQRFKAETIAKEFALRYQTTPKDSLSFVREIRENIMKMNTPFPDSDHSSQAMAELKNYIFSPFAIHHYKFGNQQISFSYESLDFEYYIHPLIGHLETAEMKGECPLFELFAHQESIVFRFDGEVKGIWSPDETHLVKGMIFMYLINVIYGKTEDDWLMTVHASAITNGRKTILFSAAPGNGKTTMAALLQTRGFKLISDDFVPIDRNFQNAHPFPIAMSVKVGSMKILASHFPELEQKQLNFISPEKSVRYLATGNKNELTENVFPVKEFIFIKYDPTVDFTLEKLDTLKGIKLLLDQSWVPPVKGNAEILFETILQKSFYQLTYSNNEKALEAITNLFEND
jgi:hypothetical protein